MKLKQKEKIMSQTVR